MFGTCAQIHCKIAEQKSWQQSDSPIIKEVTLHSLYLNTSVITQDMYLQRRYKKKGYVSTQEILINENWHKMSGKYVWPNIVTNIKHCHRIHKQ